MHLKWGPEGTFEQSPPCVYILPWLGATAQHVRQCTTQAKKAACCVVQWSTKRHVADDNVMVTKILTMS